MPVTDTPLRYPGGKSQLIPFVVDLLRENDLFYGQYAEPFAGGAGIPVHLLVNGYVDHVYINDFDPAIYAFWHSVVNEADALCQMVQDSEVTIEEWRRQRAIHFSASVNDPLVLGFSTLFLNRTNRSGILKAGVIGGQDQKGDYKLDCRFHKGNLIKKIKRIANYRDQITITQLDAVQFIKKIVPKMAEKSLVNLDPPYFCKGPELYTNFYQADDHATLAEAVGTIDRHWIVTYDNAEEIKRLYGQYPVFTYGLNYSAQLKRVGTELLVISPGLNAPASIFETEPSPVLRAVKSEALLIG